MLPTSPLKVCAACFTSDGSRLTASEKMAPCMSAAVARRASLLPSLLAASRMLCTRCTNLSSLSRNWTLSAVSPEPWTSHSAHRKPRMQRALCMHETRSASSSDGACRPKYSNPSVPSSLFRRASNKENLSQPGYSSLVASEGHSPNSKSVFTIQSMAKYYFRIKNECPFYFLQAEKRFLVCVKASSTGGYSFSKSSFRTKICFF
mmetsp:Transcript_30518/g.72672  ORF Transcript_30518/g.72672 Transcript_30518/m.72672 type:complete len:205 (+) Transcript_30518:797-1411(+)